MNDTQYLAIDIGNTFTKLGIFLGGKLSQVEKVLSLEIEAGLEKLLPKFDTKKPLIVGFISVAREIPVEYFALWQHFPHLSLFRIDHHFPFPIQNQYATPHTLGIDRIVAVVGAWANHKASPILVIDAGTAITYDVLAVEKGYLGGGISPGIKMRFRALHEFTARLPLIENIQHCDLIGNSSQNSMLSGVINGTVAEIQGIITQYRQHFGEGLVVYFTGGDSEFLAQKIDCEVIIDEFLVLKGIHELIQKNGNS